MAPVDSRIVHLVYGYGKLPNTQRESQERVFPCLSTRTYARLKLAPFRRDEEYSGIRLAGSCDHVLYEVSVPRSVNNCEEVVRSLKLQETKVNCQPSLSLFLQRVENPGELEGALAQFACFFLESFDRPVVD